MLHSYPKQSIIKEAEQSIKDGCKELWITSQDNSAYGLDIYSGLEFPSLIKEITKIKGDFFIRLGMMNPDNTIKIRNNSIPILY